MCGSHSGLDRRPSDAVVRLAARCSRVTPHALRLCSRLLCPTSLHCSGLGDWCVDVCKTCKSSLDAKRTVSPPKNSIANGNFRGYASLVPELADLPEPVSYTATWSTSGQWDFVRNSLKFRTCFVRAHIPVDFLWLTSRSLRSGPRELSSAPSTTSGDATCVEMPLPRPQQPHSRAAFFDMV